MKTIYKSTWLGIVALLGLSSTSALASLQLASDQRLQGDERTYSGDKDDLGSFGDKASSVKNTDRANAWVLYDDDHYGDRRFCIRPGQTINNLHDPRWRFGDKISSVNRLGTRSCSGYPTF
jgi:hypothetical protein